MAKEWNDYLELIKQRPEEFIEREEMKIVLDEDKVIQYEEKTGKKIGVIYKSDYRILVVDLIQDKAGEYYAYERLLSTVKDGAVVALPIYDDKFVILKQFRHALRDYQYAFPRGFAEPGMSPEDNLRKELSEELGAKIIKSEFIGTIEADSGLSENKVSVYKCILENVELKYHYEGIEEVILLSEQELKEWIREGKITDGFTLAVISLSNIINK